MYKLSIIVPVYNAEKQIERCIKSLLCQLSPEVEIVLINDGSTDGSKEIMEDYAKRYPEKIHAYHTQNQGVAEARNTGIKKAQGKYISFVDADDYIEFDLVQTIEKYMDEDIDLIKFKLKRVTTEGEVTQKVDGPIFHKITGEEGFNLLAFEDVLLDSPCVYLFKKVLFTENHFTFCKGTEHEDFGLIPLVILKAKTMISLPIYGYYYRQSQDSITRNDDYERTKKKFEDVLHHYDHLLTFLETEDLAPQTKKNVKTYYTNAIILKLRELRKEEQKKYLTQIKNRNMISNIQVNNIKQAIKKGILYLNVRWYLKLK